MSTPKTKTTTKKKANSTAARTAAPKSVAKSSASAGSAVDSTAAPNSVTGASTTVAPTVVSKAEPVVLGPVMRKRELIEKVVARSGIKKKDAKPVIEAMLAELGEALFESRELVLPPFGKAKVNRQKILPNGRVMMVKLRQSTQNKNKAPDSAE